MIYLVFKNIFDIFFSLISLFLFFPFLISITIAIKISSKGPAFFVQKRIGLKGRSFFIYKFRTMFINSSRKNKQIKLDDPEITLIGKILRRYKIDELPQLFNVIKGDMSFIGPRPILEETYNSLPKWACERFYLKPGITGLAQVNGNIFLSWKKRWVYDCEYVQNYSFLLDLKIVLKTILIIIIGEKIFKKN